MIRSKLGSSFLLGIAATLASQCAASQPVPSEQIIEQLPTTLGSLMPLRSPGSTMVVYRNATDSLRVRVNATTQEEAMTLQHLIAIAKGRGAPAFSELRHFAFIRAGKPTGYAGLYLEFRDSDPGHVDGIGIRHLWLLKSGNQLLDVQAVTKNDVESAMIKDLVNNDLLGKTTELSNPEGVQ